MKKYRMMAALCVAFLLTISFSTVAYAGGGETHPGTNGTPGPGADSRSQSLYACRNGNGGIMPPMGMEKSFLPL